MAGDPIVEEIHKIRETIAQRFGNDLRAIHADALKRQGQSGRKVVQSVPKLLKNKRRSDTAA